MGNRKRKQKKKKKKGCFLPCCSTVNIDEGEDTVREIPNPLLPPPPPPKKVGSVLVSSESPSIKDTVVIMINKKLNRANKEVETSPGRAETTTRVVNNLPPKDFALPGQCYQEEIEAPPIIRPIIERAPTPIMLTPKRVFISQQCEFFEDEPKDPIPEAVEEKKTEETPPESQDGEKKKKKKRRRKKTKEEKEICDTSDPVKNVESEPITIEDLDARPNENKDSPREPDLEQRELPPTKLIQVEERKTAGNPLKIQNFSPKSGSQEKEAKPDKTRPVRNFSYSRHRVVTGIGQSQGYEMGENLFKSTSQVDVSGLHTTTIQVKPIKSATSLTKEGSDDEGLDKRSQERREARKAMSPAPPRGIIVVQPANAMEVSDIDDEELDKRAEDRKNARRNMSPISQRSN